MDILFLVFLFLTQNYFILSLDMNIICKQSERRALLSFKQHLIDPYDSLSSWSGQNCCRWDGVVCSASNTTDHHVVQLQLQELGLGGELNPSLQELKQLGHLDLSLNDFYGISIPGFVGSLQSLRYLNLSHAGFSGMIPHQLGNLSNLRYLDLSSSFVNLQLIANGNFQWISHLSSLKHLDLSGANLENASSNWFHSVNMLPSLLVLRLHDCSLSGGALPTSLRYVNFTSLEVLDISWNINLNSTLPEWLYSLTNLQQLDLWSNSFQGRISASIGNLTKLTLLDLCSNSFQGTISPSIGNLTKLTLLDLSSNSFQGTISPSIGNLTKLTLLDLSGNRFTGEISGVLGSLLLSIDLSYNQLSGPIPLSIGRLSLLKKLSLAGNKLNGSLPESLGNLSKLGTLDLSRTGISGTIPPWFWNFTTNHFTTVDLSHNELHGELPKEVINATAISLKSSRFSGQLPRVSSDVYELDLSNNSFSGPISTFLCNPPPSISENNNLVILDLSDNLLSGNLSDCWVYWAHLSFLTLEGNKITGNISSSMGSLLELRELYLSDNSLSGELPSSLRNCTALTDIDLGKNGFTGRLPIWLGESLLGLQYLRLRSNKFYGEIPLELCHLHSIQVLDIAHNDLRGSIPRCFNNFSVLATKEHGYAYMVNIFGNSVEKTELVVKGRELDYSSIGRGLVTSLDLSKNTLSGEIPEELTSLIGLISLNLSDNYFTGKIPEKIGNMSLLESLDFSRNRISGVIPQSISNLSFLGYLNLSYNNLSGKIPSSTQLQSFNESSYIGNEDLCGFPLNKCNGEEPPPQKPPGDRADEDEDWFEMKWFYLSMGVGFVFGFWVFCGVMVLKSSWRIAYFRFLDDTKDKFCLLF